MDWFINCYYFYKIYYQNRTGYLICRYLIQEKNWSATQAIESDFSKSVMKSHSIQGFEAARGYPIERGHYIQSLYKIEKFNNPK
jgi:hypothetical protein